MPEKKWKALEEELARIAVTPDRFSLSIVRTRQVFELATFARVTWLACAGDNLALAAARRKHYRPQAGQTLEMRDWTGHA